MFPLSTVLFPSGHLPLHIFEPRYRRLTVDCLEGSRELGVVLITRGREVGGGDLRAAIGTVGRIEQAVDLPDGRWLLSVAGRRRVRVVEWLDERPYPAAMAEDLDAPHVRGRAGSGEQHDRRVTPAARASVQAALSAVRRARALLSELGGGAALPAAFDAAVLATAVDEAAWLLCDAAPLGDLDRQRLLEARGAEVRLDLVRSLAEEVADDLARLLRG